MVAPTEAELYGSRYAKVAEDEQELRAAIARLQQEKAQAPDPDWQKSYDAEIGYVNRLLQLLLTMEH